MRPFHVAIVGAGPTGLIAAEKLATADDANSLSRPLTITIYDAMPSPGRKFLMAGRGGLNLTHSEAISSFRKRYGNSEADLLAALKAFSPEDLRAWCETLGEATFVGTSGRIFPKTMKSSPLLRAWLRRLTSLGIDFNLRSTWTGWNEAGALRMQSADGMTHVIHADATLLALGGASWPRLGSNGQWVKYLETAGVPVSPLRPANCGFTVAWSAIFRERFAGTPLKSMSFSCGDHTRAGEAMITKDGIEGNAIYALSGILREMIDREGSAKLTIDLKPNLTHHQIKERLGRIRGGDTFSAHLRKSVGLSAVAIGLIQEILHVSGTPPYTPKDVIPLIKALPVALLRTGPLEHAISTAGGVKFSALNQHLMLHKIPGVFVAGEMLDWEAPTGGYLLQACFSTGVLAACGIRVWLENEDKAA